MTFEQLLSLVVTLLTTGSPSYSQATLPSKPVSNKEETFILSWDFKITEIKNVIWINKGIAIL